MIILQLLCFLFVSISHSQMSNGETYYHTQFQLSAVLNLQGVSTKKLGCGEGETKKFRLDSFPIDHAHSSYQFKFDPSTNFEITCLGPQWKVKVDKEFYWREVKYLAGSELVVGFRLIRVEPAKNVVIINGEEVKNPGALDYDSSWKIYVFKLETKDDHENLKIKTTSLQTKRTVLTVTKYYKTKDVGDCMKYPLGSEIYYYKDTMEKIVLAQDIQCDDVRIPQNSTVWFVSPGKIAKLSKDGSFLDLVIPKDSYLIRDTNKWVSVVFSRPINYNGKTYPPAKIFALELFDPKHIVAERTKTIPQALYLDQSGNKIVPEPEEVKVIYPLDNQKFEAISNGIRQKDGMERHDFVTLFGDGRASHAFRSFETDICNPSEVLVKCHQESVFTVIDGGGRFWGIADDYHLAGDVSLVKFAKTTFPKEIVSGEILCSPRTSPDVFKWRFEASSKKMEFKSSCFGGELPDGVDELMSYEKSHDLYRYVGKKQIFYFNDEKFVRVSETGKDSSIYRIRFQDSKDYYFYRIDDKYLRVDGPEKYLYPDDTEENYGD